MSSTSGTFELGKIILKVPLSKKDPPNPSYPEKMADERILFQKFGKFWNQQNKFDRPDGEVLVTTHRLMFFTKIRTLSTTTEFLSMPFELIQNPEKIKIWLITPAL